MSRPSKRRVSMSARRPCAAFKGSPPATPASASRSASDTGAPPPRPAPAGADSGGLTKEEMAQLLEAIPKETAVGLRDWAAVELL